MFSEKTSIFISVILLSALFSYSNIKIFPMYIGIFSLIVLVNILSKKAAAYFLEVDAESSIWGWQQYWFAERHKFPKPVPIGILLPIFVLVYSYGLVKWLGILETNFKEKITKTARKRKAWSYPSLRDFDVALICFAGLAAEIVLAFIFISVNPEISKLTMFYAFFNLIPFGRLDGLKLAMSNILLYITAVIIFLASSVLLGIVAIL